MRETGVDKATTAATQGHDRDSVPMWSPVGRYAVVKVRRGKNPLPVRLRSQASPVNEGGLVRVF